MLINHILDVNLYIPTTKSLLAYMYSKLISNKKIYLISERYNQARDNGYIFFKYLREKHPEMDVYYVIDKNAKDREKINKYGNIINYNSLKHYLYFCISKVHISAHDDMCLPKKAILLRKLKNKLGYKDVFIPHGVSYGISEFCLAKYNKFDLFICSGKQEYDNLLNNYGYKENQLAFTGFPRLDEWHNIDINDKQILLMPTWRSYIAQNKNINFIETSYYKTYQSILNSKELDDVLNKNSNTLIFYLHDSMKQYINCFSTNSNNIKIITDYDKYDIQELLKSSALLITDYSSVHFDFSYMNKPVLYYQFDKDEFYEKQYRKGLFDVEKDGFGVVTYKEIDLIKEIKNSILNKHRVSDKYSKRMKQFYQIYDDKNCERVLNAIKDKENIEWFK